MTNRYQKTFGQCKNENRIALVPFVVIGDPDIDTSIKIIKQLIDSGADALELGVPFSDPIADGPIIQASTIRALNSGFKISNLEKVFNAIREYNADIPIGLLMYANLVMNYGIKKFVQDCAKWQVDSILVADIPAQEAELITPHTEKYGVQSVFIAPPNATDETLEHVAKLSQGYTYLLGRVGITGTHVEVDTPLEDVVNKLHSHNAAPLVQGFGISKPEHIAQAVKTGLDGAICGSAIVNLIAQSMESDDDLAQTLAKLDDFIQRLKKATYK